MKFDMKDFKTLTLIVVGGVIVMLLLYAGDEYDIPLLKTAHEGAGG
ncbi:MAG: hypothetical protein JKY60_20170 [Kordiimonadaceae bacterium]|nr:hypothetical protein [Kordiimonadaceae bacterium]